jgi:iron complex transport system ATP-binding protein
MSLESPESVTSLEPGSAAIGLHGVAVARRGRWLLQPLDLEVEAGTWLGIVGPNGAGKTTLLRSLAGTIRHEGTVTIHGQPVTRLGPRPRARLIAVAPQQPTIPAGMPVGDYVALGRTAHIPLLGVESQHDRTVVAEVLARLELTDLAHRELSTLSGGERQRAIIGRALAQEAPILLLDEPTTALDIGHQQQVLDLVDELRHEHDLTVVSAMHDLTLAAQHAERFLLLDEGRVAASGRAAEVFTTARLESVFGATVTVLHDDGELVIVPRRRQTGV